MKRKLSIIILSILLFSKAYSQQSQEELNDVAYQEYKYTDGQVTDTYKKLLNKYSKDTVFVINLKKSQRLWALWRDAEVKAFYPDYEIKDFYGPNQPSCYYNKLKEYNEIRLKQLQKYIEKVEDGDNCGPGVSAKN